MVVAYSGTTLVGYAVRPACSCVCIDTKRGAFLCQQVIEAMQVFGSMRCHCMGGLENNRKERSFKYFLPQLLTVLALVLVVFRSQHATLALLLLQLLL